MRRAFRVRDVVSFAAFGMILVFVLNYFAASGLRVSPPSHRIQLSMDVPDVNSLAVGSSVLLRGAQVGKISSIQTTLRAATIDFWVEGQYQIPVDTEVQLENLSALGESFIGLIPRSEGGPMLHDKQRIATEAVKAPGSISELATSVVRVLHQLDPGALRRILAEADAALPDPVAVLPNISHASTLVRNAFAGMHGQGRELLGNFQTLLRESEWFGPSLEPTSFYIKELGKAYRDILADFATIMSNGEPENIINFNNFLQRIQAFLDDRGPDLKVLGEAFLPKLNLIAAALMNFDTGQILDRMLAAIPPDGTVTLRVVP